MKIVKNKITLLILLRKILLLIMANPYSYSKYRAIVLTVEKTAQRFIRVILMDSKLSSFDLYQLNANKLSKLSLLIMRDVNLSFERLTLIGPKLPAAKNWRMSSLLELRN